MSWLEMALYHGSSEGVEEEAMPRGACSLEEKERRNSTEEKITQDEKEGSGKRRAKIL